jgi:hypothetical protein
MVVYTLKKYYWVVAVLVLCIPMVMLNTGDKQHWGDDFAQYLLQAKYISMGVSPYKTGFIANADNTLPPMAPVGFSVLLVPVVALFGLNSMAPFVMLMSLAFCLVMLLAAVIFKKHLSAGMAVLLVFVAFYPNFMFWMKLLITSDVPFTVGLIVLLMLQLKRQNIYLSIVLGLLFGSLMLTRNVIIVMPFAMFASIVFKYIFYGEKLESVKWCVVQTSVGILFYVVVTYFVFPSSVDYPSWAMGHLTLGKIGAIVKDNFFHYYANVVSLFTSHDGTMQHTSFAITVVFSLFFLLGFAKRLLKGDYWAFFTLAYLLLILSVNIVSDYRYLIPVHCFLVLFAAEGFLSLFRNKKVRLVLGIATAVFFISIYKNHVEYLYSIRKEPLPGPTTVSAKEIFKFIKANVDDKAVIVFPKPRALTLFTDKKTTINSWTKSPEESYTQLKNLGVHYFLKAHTTTDEKFDSVIGYCRPNLSVVFENNEFVLYHHAGH